MLTDTVFPYFSVSFLPIYPERLLCQIMTVSDCRVWKQEKFFDWISQFYLNLHLNTFKFIFKKPTLQKKK